MLTLLMALALNVQDAEPVSPGACRVAAENFLEALPRIRAAIEKDPDNSPSAREGLLKMLDADLAVAQRVKALHGAAPPDKKPLAGMRGSQQVDYMHRCDPNPREAAN